jgi:hypothetical protein
MSSKAPTYKLIQDFGIQDFSKSDAIISTSPHWLIVVVRLGLPLSYSRANRKSVTTDVSQGALLRGDNLLIASDCYSLSVTGSKESHLKSMTAELHQTDHNYLVEILPGDWVLAWIMNDEESLYGLISRVKKSDPSNSCNLFDDGFKFVGRVDSIRKRMTRDRGSGVKTSTVTLSCVAFRELDSQLFYDPYLTNAADTSSIGSWLAAIGLDIETIFSVDVKNGVENNSQKLISNYLDILVGKGVGSRLNRADADVQAAGQGNQGRLSVASGAGASSDTTSPHYAYIVPRAVGNLLGKGGDEVSKPGGFLSFADLMDTVMGIQSYSTTNFNPSRPGDIFLPDLTSATKASTHMSTGTPLLGTYIPVMPNFTNTPLWSVLQQFLNPTINEMYTCLHINPQGIVVPTMVVRQIPFTTEAWSPPSGPSIAVTKFLSIPRWYLHPAMIFDLDIGRSDATRFNFIHIYGQDANEYAQNTFSQQIVNNPPIRDDLDIQRSGLRPYMTTVAAQNKDNVGATPTSWIALVADRVIGSQYTLNGTISCVGIRSPICEGDNVEFDGVVYHIESFTHHAVISGDGHRSFTTTLNVSNGIRSDGTTDIGPQGPAGTSGRPGAPAHPIYPGFLPDDNTEYDPGHSVDDRLDRSSPKTDQGDLATAESPAGGVQAGNSDFTKNMV